MRAKGPDAPNEPSNLAWATLIRAELDSQFPRSERLPERFTPRSRHAPFSSARTRQLLAVMTAAVVLAGVATTVVARTAAPEVVARFLSSRSGPTPSVSPSPTEPAIGTGVATLTPASRATAPSLMGHPRPSTWSPAPTSPSPRAPGAPSLSSSAPGPATPAAEPSPSPTLPPSAPSSSSGPPTPSATPVPSPPSSRRLCLLVICL
jgi:hypothetical protein